MIESLLMCPPIYLNARVPNNAWMRDLASTGSIVIDREKAFHQWHAFKRLVDPRALVYLAQPQPCLQDQTYCTDAGVVLPHLEKTFVASRFRGEERQGEPAIIRRFLRALGYSVYSAPFAFEGESECKHLRDAIYFLGYGQKTDIRMASWLRDSLGADIITIEESDPYLYHLDCSVKPIDGSTVLVSTETVTPADLRAIEHVAAVVPFSKADAYACALNGVLVGQFYYVNSSLDELQKGTEDYAVERHKVASVEAMCSKQGLTPVFVNISELEKSGAALSCCVLHLGSL